MTNKPSITIHEDRLCDEVLLQLMIKEPVLQEVKIADLRRLARYYSKTVRNIIYHSKNGIVKEITDEAANNEEWLKELLLNNYSIRK